MTGDVQTPRIPPSVAAFFPDAKPVWPSAPSPRAPLDCIDQIAIVVADIDAAIEYFGAAFGWGPFYRATAHAHTRYRGEQVYFELALAFVMVGDLEIELVQPLGGDNPYRDQLQDGGEGIFHVRFATDDIEAQLEHLREFGIEPILGWHEGRWITANLDSQHRFGLRAELVLPRERLAEVLAGLGRTHSVPPEDRRGPGREGR